MKAESLIKRKFRDSLTSRQTFWSIRYLKIYMKNFNTSAMILPSYLKLLSSNLGTRKFYSFLNKQYNNLALKNKWNNILNTDLDEKDLINIYKVCFRSLRRNDFIWFQFRLIQRILGTKTYLIRLK